MSGHSKWANIKHRKGKADAERGKAFTKVTREIMVAAKEGGGDPDANFRLRLAIEKARAVNMPADNIQRAIKRGIGEMEGENLEELMYEGYGPNGVAVLLDILTDSRNRTASEVRHIFSRHGGSLGETGCVAWMFDPKGVLVIDRTSEPGSKLSEDELMLTALDAGAEDVQTGEDVFEIITSPQDFSQVKTTLEAQGIVFSSAEISRIPKNLVPLDQHQAAQVMKLLEALEDNDDVQNVYSNADFPENMPEE